MLEKIIICKQLYTTKVLLMHYRNKYTDNYPSEIHTWHTTKSIILVTDIYFVNIMQKNLL
jgi:hypothetical protein